MLPSGPGDANGDLSGWSIAAMASSSTRTPSQDAIYSHVRFGGVENLLGLDSIIARGLHDLSEVLNAKVDFVPLVEKGRGKMWRHRCARTSFPMDQH